MRNFLGGFAFQGDRIDQAVEHFSGGEKARLALALIAWQKPNLLLLDEPTNHLDMEMRHALTIALQAFEGAMLLVSHDRALIRDTTDELWLVADGKVINYNDDLDSYTRWLAQFRQQQAAAAQPETSNAPKVDAKAQRRAAAELRQRLAPLKKAADKLEQQLASANQEHAGVEAELGDPSVYEANNKDNLKQLLARQASCQQRIDELEESWLLAHEELDSLQTELQDE